MRPWLVVFLRKADQSNSAYLNTFLANLSRNAVKFDENPNVNKRNLTDESIPELARLPVGGRDEEVVRVVKVDGLSAGDDDGGV